MVLKKYWGRVLSVACLQFIMTCYCDATENFFLPGDAFFPIVLTKQSLEDLKTSPKDYVFKYDTNRVGGSMAGYAGFRYATIENADDQLVINLEDAYKLYREFVPRILIESDVDGNTILTETNGMRGLIYSTHFEFPKNELGLTYNEAWIDEVMKFGHPRKMALFSCLVDSPEAVARSWRDALDVRGLDVALPQVKRLPTKIVSEPIKIVNEIQILIPLSATLTEVWKRSLETCIPPGGIIGPPDLAVAVVTTTRVDLLVYRGNRWQSSTE